MNDGQVVVDLPFVHDMAYDFVPNVGRQFADMTHIMASVHSTFGEMGEAEAEWQAVTGALQTAMAECSDYMRYTARSLADAGRDFEQRDGENAEDLTWKHKDFQGIDPARPGNDPSPDNYGLTEYGY